MKHEALIKQMTLEEKASMMSGKDFWQTVDIERLGIPSITLSDGPHGLRKQAGDADHLGLNASVPATCFPTAATVANSWDPSLGAEIGSHIAQEAIEQGVHVVLGPGLNIKRSPLCGRNFEYFSEDPYLAGKMAAGYIQGIQSLGVAACPKHFAANSQELRRMSNDSVVDERTFREIYLTGFEIAVKEGKAKSIMSSYNRINGVYANENEHLLDEILVKEWGFDGFVVSDWGGSNSHVDGVRNGSHLEMPGGSKDAANELVQAVKNGILSEELLDRRVGELLDQIMEIHEATKKHTDEKVSIEQHHKMAEKAAEQSVVLLKNEDDILPLKPATKVAVIGDFAKVPRYQGAGSSIVNPTRLDCALDAMENSSLELIGYEQGFLRNGKKKEELIKSAVEFAKKAEVVLLYLGLDELAESEGMDRAHMHMAENQIELLYAIQEVNENIIVILSAGAAIETSWIKDAKAVVHGYLSGQSGASAMLHILMGEVCPSGRLSETYPIKGEDAPAFSYFPGLEKTTEYREGLYVGYRYYETAKVPVAFPFGYGLSYTSFSYADLKVEGNKVTVQLTNTGKMDGAEVVQIYISAKEGKVIRPLRELKGFQKVFLKAGESKEVCIELDDKAFRYYNTASNTWEIDGGIYLVQAGSNVSDIHLTVETSVSGTDAVLPYAKEDLPSYAKADIKQVSDGEFEKLLEHPIPESKWKRGGDLDINDAFCQMYYAKTGLARFVCKILTRIKDKSMAKGNPNLNVLFIYNMPFRGIAKMTGGAVTMEMAYALLEMVNGHFFRGLRKFIGGFFHSKKKS